VSQRNAEQLAQRLARRDVIFGCGSAVVGLSTAAGEARAATPPNAQLATKGDRLVLDGAGPAVTEPLRPEGLADGELVAVLPLELSSGTVRNGSRFNKIVLVRVEEALLDEQSRRCAAAGVIAYSAVCTHQGCTLSGWRPEAQIISCFCHNSEFSALESGKVMKGPARRRLPLLPLALAEDGTLMVADEFTAKPGFRA
jgi:rieske iron-sulfur protein